MNGERDLDLADQDETVILEPVRRPPRRGWPMLSMREIITRTIDSTPTEYRGVQMRSRLEADFAAHLDRHGFDWIYEPAIFGPRGAGYLPDFLIDTTPGRTYVEVKPTLAQAEQAKRRMEVIWATYPNAVLLVVCAEGSTFFAGIMGEGWTSWRQTWKHQ